jgi:high-affinity Fe2+/Pb2+ permease
VNVSPLAADRIRKGAGYALAIAITLLLFRVLGRTAGGRQSLLDGELWALLALVALAVLWVRAAKRVRRAERGEGPRPPDGSAPGQ